MELLYLALIVMQTAKCVVRCFFALLRHFIHRRSPLNIESHDLYISLWPLITSEQSWLQIQSLQCLSNWNKQATYSSYRRYSDPLTFHILCYNLNSKWIKYIYFSPIYTQYHIMTKWKQVFINVSKFIEN